MMNRISWTALGSLSCAVSAVAVSWLTTDAIDTVAALGLSAITLAVLSFRER